MGAHQYLCPTCLVPLTVNNINRDFNLSSKIKMISTKFLICASLFVASTFAAPQVGVWPLTGLPYNPDANTVDANGCTVGYCSRVCPTGAITNDGRFVTNRGNKGSAGTGSNKCWSSQCCLICYRPCSRNLQKANCCLPSYCFTSNSCC